MMMLLGFAMVPDAAQSVLLGSLRGLADVWPAVVIQIAGFWGVMVVGSWWFVIHQRGDVGMLLLFIGLGALVVMVGLGARFYSLQWRFRLAPV